MIQMQSILEVVDNSGVKTAVCVKTMRGSDCGDLLVVAPRRVIPGAKVKKGVLCKALIVRTKKGVRRPDGSVVRFDSNAVVLVDKQNEPIGTRAFGPTVRELKDKGFSKVLSLAPEVI